MKKKICICGGGSLGIVCASVFLSRGNDVKLLTNHSQSWSKEISSQDNEGRSYSGFLSGISNVAAEVVPNSDIVLLCVPGYLIKEVLTKIKPYVSKDMAVGSVVASTGFFFESKKIIGNSVTLFGFQRVPYICRIQKYGHSGLLLGYKDSLNVCIENSQNPYALCKELERLFDTPIKMFDNYLEVSLTNSNPILHTGRLYSMWKDREDERIQVPIYFYRDWTNKDSEIVLAMDREFMKLTACLKISRDKIPSLLEYYECSDYEEFTAKIGGGYKGIWKYYGSDGKNR